MDVSLRTRTLKKILAKKNLSQNAFAHYVKVSSGHMSLLLCGKRNPRPQTRERILKTLNSVQRLRGNPEYQFDDLFVIRD